MMERIKKYRRHRDFLIGLLLFGGTLALYWPSASYDYINIDDPDYAAHNFILKQGFSKEAIAWAFTTTKTANWHPVTWISYLADVQFLGSSARIHHVVNLLFHALNAVLLNIVFRRMTNAAGLSLIVALLFAVHPLNIESVVWISERKNVLSTLFWLLVMGCYTRYTKTKDTKAYLGALIFFAIGLMAKPMLVTLPCALLLLDFWPLGRLFPGPNYLDHKTKALKNLGALLWEKIPFFILTIASSIVTFWAQQIEGAVKSLEIFPFTLRLANALVSYSLYLKKIVGPHALAIFYPYPSNYHGWQVSGAIILLAALSYLALRTRKRHPYVLFGWLWYIGTLVPVIGIVQVGSQAMADRYAYIPAIGIVTLIVWGAHALIRQRGINPIAAATAAGLAIAALATVTWNQMPYWQNSQTLLHRAIAVTKDNHFAHNNLGSDYAQKGQFEKAARHYREALRAKQDYWTAQNNLGLAMDKMGRLTDALEHYAKALQMNPENDEVHNNIGSTMAKMGRWDEAQKHYRQAVQINPRNAAAHSNLATALAKQGHMQKAIAHYVTAVQVDPYLETAIVQLALVYLHQGRHRSEQRRAAAAGKSIDNLPIGPASPSTGRPRTSRYSLPEGYFTVTAKR